VLKIVYPVIGRVLFMTNTRILVVDDELDIIKLLRANLRAAGYEVFTVMNGVEALEVVEKEAPDLMLLDITMPKMDGFEVCRRVREWSQVPIIMVSALNDESDKLRCLDIGADDYVTKPFSKDELIARARAVIRRSKSSVTVPARPSFISGGLRIDFIRRQVTVSGKEIKLTPTEYNLLQELVLNAGKVLTYNHLLNKVWGPEYSDEKEYLHVFISRLRTKLEENPTSPEHIITVSGVGYRFTDEA
jgi:two-component system KDP operon response regulator KdpE